MVSIKRGESAASLASKGEGVNDPIPQTSSPVSCYNSRLNFQVNKGIHQVNRGVRKPVSLFCHARKCELRVRVKSRNFGNTHTRSNRWADSVGLYPAQGRNDKGWRALFIQVRPGAWPNLQST